MFTVRSQDLLLRVDSQSYWRDTGAYSWSEARAIVSGYTNRHVAFNADGDPSGQGGSAQQVWAPLLVLKSYEKECDNIKVMRRFLRILHVWENGEEI